MKKKDYMINIKLPTEKGQKIRHAADVNPICRWDNIGIKYHELGRMDELCIHYDAKFWMDEKD